MKTLTSDDSPLRCATCPAITEWPVDRARGAKWRVPWTPGEPVYCPDCYGNKIREKRPVVQDWDVPLFPLEEKNDDGH